MNAIMQLANATLTFPTLKNVLLNSGTELHGESGPMSFRDADGHAWERVR